VHPFEVVRNEQLTPHLIRVVLGGKGFDTFIPNEFTDAYVKIRLRQPGRRRRRAAAAAHAGQLHGPTRRAAAHGAHLHGAQCRHQSAVRSPSTSSVHGEHGVAGPWAAAAAPGTPAYLTSPNGAYAPDPAADWHLFAGDEAAVPAIGAALEALPNNAIGKVFLEVAGPEEEDRAQRTRWCRGEMDLPRRPVRPGA